MTRYVNVAIETKVQVLDSNSDPATAATVNYKVYDEADALFDSGTMTHIADGIYTVSWTPDAVGAWTFESYSTNPKFRDSRAYNIESASIWANQPLAYLSLIPPLFDTWDTLINETGVIKVIHATIYQFNDESAAKNIDVEITYNGGTPITFTVAANNSTPYHLYMASSVLGGYVANTLATSFFGNFDDGTTNYISIPVECSSIVIRLKMTSALGTNQELVGSVEWAKKM